jgi:hypothetical protein
MDKVANDMQVGGSHYKEADGVQHWDFTWENGYNQFEYSVSKYVYRYPKKGGVQDLHKAMHHLEKYFEVDPSAGVPLNRTYMVCEDWCVLKGLGATQTSILCFLHLHQLLLAMTMLHSLIEQEEGGPTSMYVNQD